MNKKLRLLLWEDCLRHCAGCCNRDYDFSAIPICHSYVGYDMIMLTGGEPMLYPDRLKSIIREIRRKTKTPIILYTAETTNIEELSDIVRCIDGVTVTLHQPSDFDDFLRFDHYHTNEFGSPRSYRLNIFKGVNLDTGEVKGRWKIKANIDWISKAPLPEGETLMRYNSQSE